MSLDDESKKIEDINVKMKGNPKKYIVEYDDKLYQIKSHSKRQAEFMTRLMKGGMKPENRNKKAVVKKEVD